MTWIVSSLIMLRPNLSWTILCGTVILIGNLRKNFLTSLLPIVKDQNQFLFFWKTKIMSLQSKEQSNLSKKEPETSSPIVTQRNCQDWDLNFKKNGIQIIFFTVKIQKSRKGMVWWRTKDSLRHVSRYPSVPNIYLEIFIENLY